jgi:hypothetical protein
MVGLQTGSEVLVAAVASGLRGAEIGGTYSKRG